MENVAGHLDDRHKYEQYLQHLGRVHESQLTVDKSSMDVMGPMFCQAIRPVLQASAQWNQDVRDSWIHLFRIISYWIKQGYSSASAGSEEVKTPDGVSRPRKTNGDGQLLPQ